MIRFLFFFALGVISFTLLLDWFIQLTREPVSVLCDGGEGMRDE